MRTITLTGYLRDVTGAPATGWIQIAAVNTVLVPDADTVIAEQPADRELVDGRFAVPLVLPTEPGSTAPVLVELRQLLTGTRPIADVLDVHTDADTIDLADAPRVVLIPTDGQGLAVIPWSAVGQPGGVAPLGSNGRVPAQYLPASGGGTGGLSHHHIQEQPQAVWPVEHLLGQRPSSVAAFSPDWATQYDEFTVHHLDEDHLLIEGNVPAAGHALIGI